MSHLVGNPEDRFSRVGAEFSFIKFCGHQILLKLTLIMQVMKRNSRQREEEKENGGGMMDGQMLWFIMNQLRRGRRRVCGLLQEYLNGVYMV